MKLCPICLSEYSDEHTTCPSDNARLIETKEWQPGQMVANNKYLIVAKIGRGGMGTVFKASHVALDEIRALKLMDPQFARDPQFVARFRNEAKAARRLSHPNAVHVDDLDQSDDGSLFIAMEFVDGVSLRQLLTATKGPIQLARALSITRCIADALGAAHALGMVHRDIKPDNILLGRDASGREIPKLADFGIVAIREAAFQSLRSPMTPAYASPEQRQGMKASELDGRADLYALGMTLYEMLTGRLPFDAHTEEDWKRAHLEETPLPPSTYSRELEGKADVDNLVLQLLAKDREMRPADANALIRELNLIEAPPAPAARSRAPTDHPSPGRRMKTALGVGVGLLAVAGMVFLVMRMMSKQPPEIVSFDADPRSVVAGKPVRLSWDLTHVTKFRIEPQGGEYTARADNNVVNGATVTPQYNTTYILRATGPGGDREARVSVSVVPGAGAPATRAARPTTVATAQPVSGDAPVSPHSTTRKADTTVTRSTSPQPIPKLDPLTKEASKDAPTKETSSDPRKELASIGVAWSTQSFVEALQASDARVVGLFLDGGMSPTVLHKGTAAALYILQPLLPDPIPMLKLMIAKGYDVNATLTDAIIMSHYGSEMPPYWNPAPDLPEYSSFYHVFSGPALMWVAMRAAYAGPTQSDLAVIDFLRHQGADTRLTQRFLAAMESVWGQFPAYQTVRARVTR